MIIFFTTIEIFFLLYNVSLFPVLEKGLLEKFYQNISTLIPVDNKKNVFEQSHRTSQNSQLLKQYAGNEISVDCHKIKRQILKNHSEKVTTKYKNKDCLHQNILKNMNSQNRIFKKQKRQKQKHNKPTESDTGG